MAEQVILTAELTAKNGKTEELKDLLISLLEPSRAEAGCLQYDLHTFKENSSTFIFYETWKDQAAFDSHSATPHFKHFADNVGELIAAEPEVIYLNKIG